jgi:hypothetical protein
MARSRFILSMKGLGRHIKSTPTYQTCIRKAENVVLSGVSKGLTLLYIYDDRRGEYERWRFGRRY